MSFATTSGVQTTPRPRPIGPTSPMTFGKHKGLLIEAVPPDYLRWALKNTDSCNQDHEQYWPELRQTFEALVGQIASQPPLFNGRMLGFSELCQKLADHKVVISLDRGKVVVDDPAKLSEAEATSLGAFQYPLARLLSCVQGSATESPGGSAKLIRSADLRCRVKAWYGRLSRQFHPDAGGSDQAQGAVNACYKSLIKILADWERAR